MHYTEKVNGFKLEKLLITLSTNNAQVELDMMDHNVLSGEDEEYKASRYLWEQALLDDEDKNTYFETTLQMAINKFRTENDFITEGSFIDLKFK